MLEPKLCLKRMIQSLALSGAVVQLVAHSVAAHTMRPMPASGKHLAAARRAFEPNTLPGKALDLDGVSALLDSRMERLDPALRQATARTILLLSRRFGFEPAFVLSLIETESSFRTNAHSSAGAIGLMQLQPVTAEYIARKRGISQYKGKADLANPVLNVTLGIHYLDELKSRFVDPRHVLMAYNAGPQVVRRLASTMNRGSHGPIQKYVDRVRGRARHLHSEARHLRNLNILIKSQQSNRSFASWPLLGMLRF